MTALILDASAAAGYLISSQRTRAIEALFARWGEYEPAAPYVFELELTGLLLKRERQAAVRGLAREGLTRLKLLGVALGSPPDAGGRATAFALAERARIGFFDAMYVIKAADEGAVLASKDGGMLTAATAIGVAVIDVG